MFRSKKIISAIISGVFATQILMSSMFGAFGYVKAEAADEDAKVSNIIADVNGDGSRNSIDFAHMRMKLLGMIDDFPVVNAAWASDLDGNGVFNSIDFAYLRQFLLGFRDTFPAEEVIVTPTLSINTPTSTDVTPTSTPSVANDTEAPSAPTDLVATNVTDTSAVLSWNPSTDNVGVEEYGIISDGMFLLATSKESTIKITNLEANRTYELWVVATDKQGNVSETSNIYSITTTVSNMEQLKLGLVKNFKTKGTTYTFTYTGDLSDINDNISSIIYDAVNESSVPFMLEDTLYSSSESSGNYKITLDFTYEDREYSDVVRSVDKLSSVLRTKIKNRNDNIDIVFKGSISEAEIDSSINTILNEDSYLKQSIRNYSYSMGISVGITSVSFEVEYETSLEQENFVDENVKLIVDGLVNKDMSDHEKVKLIHDYVLSRVVYSDLPEYNSAYDALYYGKTVCEGYAQLTYKLLVAAGIENKIVTNEDHAWNLVKIDDKWYHMDTTWDDGKAKNDGFYKYYNMTDSELLETRNYINTTGITAASNYISDLTILNNNSNGKYKRILGDIQKNEGYVVTNAFKSNSTLDLEYTEIVLKEGEEISLISIPVIKFDDL